MGRNGTCSFLWQNSGSLEITDSLQEHHLTLMSWLVFSCGGGVLLQWSQVGVNSVTRGHSHNSDVTRFDAHIAVDCAVPCVKSPRARFSMIGKETSQRRKRITSCDSLGPGGLLFSTAATSETSHPRSLLSVSPGASRTLLKQMKNSLVFSPYESFSSTLDFAVPIITCTRKTRAASPWKRGVANWNYDACHMWHSKLEDAWRKKKKTVSFDTDKLDLLQAEPGSNSSRHPAKDDMRPAGNWNLVAEPWCGVWLYSCQSQSGVDIFPPPRTPPNLIKQLLLQCWCKFPKHRHG